MVFDPGSDVDIKARLLLESFLKHHIDDAVLWKFDRNSFPLLPTGVVAIVSVRLAHISEPSAEENGAKLYKAITKK